jgi:hypothetical protein
MPKLGHEVIIRVKQNYETQKKEIVTLKDGTNEYNLYGFRTTKASESPRLKWIL